MARPKTEGHIIGSEEDLQDLMERAYDEGFAAAAENDCCGCNLYSDAPPNPYRRKK